MSMLLLWLRGLIARRPGRLIGTACGVAVAVALLAALGSFLAASKATMTRQAVADVAVDWQVLLATGSNPAPAGMAVAAAPKVRAALPVGVRRQHRAVRRRWRTGPEHRGGSRAGTTRRV